MSEPDIRVLVGVSGGASISGESGRTIERELKAIASQMTGSHRPRVRFSVDYAETKKVVQQQLDSIGKSMTLQIGTASMAGAELSRPTGNGKSGKLGGGSSSGSSGGQAATGRALQANAKHAELLRERLAEVQSLLNAEASSATMDSQLASINALSRQYDVLCRQVDSFGRAQENIPSGEWKSLGSEISALQRRMEDYQKTSQKAQLTHNKVIASGALELSQFNRYLTTLNPKVLGQYSGAIENIRQLFRSDMPDDIAKAKIAVTEFKAEMKSAGHEGGNIFTYMEGKIKSFATYLASAMLTNLAVNGVRNVISTVKELDESLTDLRIVTGGTRQETQDLLKTYNALAQQLGATTANTASGALDWLRQGYSQKDTNELLKQSMTLSIVGDMEAAESTNALTAALKGYKLEVEDASDVVDKYFAVDMAAATSSSDMATALAKTAANAKLAGLSLNDVIGQLAVTNETMKESGEETGTFYNTMLSRIGALKSGRLSDPETEEDLSDVEATLRGLGIELRKSDSEFRKFGDVLDEVGGKWGQFSSVQQRAIATAFAGTRQQTRFISLMEGYGQAAKYAEIAAESTGISAQKLAVYQESVEARTNRAAAAFENMATTLLDSDLIGLVMDVGAGLFNAGAAFDAFPAKAAAVIGTMVSLVSITRSFASSPLGTSFAKTFKDLAWPEKTGDIVAIHGEEAA